MFMNIIRQIDGLNIILAVLGAIALIFVDMNILEGILLVISSLLLFLSKYRPQRSVIFFSYLSSILFLGNLFLKTTEETSRSSIWLPSNITTLALFTAIIAAIAALSRFGTTTLSIVWLTTHILIFISSLQIGSFIDSFWSYNSLFLAIHRYYPFLIMSMLIGVFLEKFQLEMIREYRNR
ncbi:hypothetical protein [Peribacillus alkalitolerans]|uniref:hypothetical protein n=1 Tax=Peribacillus alkalitolerans TaxID=1550385 RepID=UPI0013D81F14|nr:hypothetical protein [Peribacillus alkalitolerans]